MIMHTKFNFRTKFCFAVLGILISPISLVDIKCYIECSVINTVDTYANVYSIIIYEIQILFSCACSRRGLVVFCIEYCLPSISLSKLSPQHLQFCRVRMIFHVLNSITLRGKTFYHKLVIS
jgi:hypothetical protein